jgi:hypothetical protein
MTARSVRISNWASTMAVCEHYDCPRKTLSVVQRPTDYTPLSGVIFVAGCDAAHLAMFDISHPDSVAMRGM